MDQNFTIILNWFTFDPCQQAATTSTITQLSRYRTRQATTRGPVISHADRIIVLLIHLKLVLDNHEHICRNKIVKIVVITVKLIVFNHE